jgi:hypothetical protein
VKAPEGVIEVRVPEIPPVPFMTRLLIVFVAVAAVIWPDVLTLKALAVPAVRVPAASILPAKFDVPVPLTVRSLAIVRAPAELMKFDEEKN